MKLRTVDGQLTLGSVFKLFVVGWICSWIALFGLIFALLLVVGVASGSMVVNGEVVHGRTSVLMQMLPFLVIFPVAVVLQGFLFAGMLTGGVWLYRLKRPLTVIVE